MPQQQQSDPWQTAAAAYKQQSGAAASPLAATAPSEDWKVWQQSSDQPEDTRNGFQRGVDELTKVEPFNQRPGVGGHILTAAGNVGGGVLSPLSMLAHPIQSAKMAVNSAAQGMSPVPNRIFQDVPSMQEGLARGMVENPSGTLENLAGGAMLGEMGGVALRGVKAAGGAIREAAMGDPNVAALKGLRVGPASPKAVSTLSAVEGARPYLKGAQSLEDLQARIPGARQEIWTPYQKAVDRVGDVQVTGPEGPTTVRDLENRRLEVSAQLRTLKSGGPEATALAQQKGLTQAGLLAEEKGIKAALDPELQKAGVNPQEVRKAFGQVSQVGGRIAGKSTLAEKPQPYGLGRMTNIKLNSPKTWLGEPIQGARDLAAGRPLWSGSPTDVNLREAFRSGGEKPDFRAPAPAMMAKPLQLEANVPGNADFGEDFSQGGPIGTPAPRVNVTPQPLKPSGLLAPSSFESRGGNIQSLKMANGDRLMMALHPQGQPPGTDFYHFRGSMGAYPPDTLAAHGIDPNKVVGYSNLGVGDEGLHPFTTEVLPQFQRQGIASRMYDQAASDEGVPVKPSSTQTAKAKALWKARNARK